jgi:hypothetical protein
MNVRHKWADVIIAIAEGIPVQFKTQNGSQFEDWNPIDWSPLSCYVMDNKWEWRIKPKEPVKRYKVAFAFFDGGHTIEHISNQYYSSIQEFIDVQKNIVWAVLLEPTMKEFEE